MTLNHSEKEAVIREVHRLFDVAERYFNRPFPLPDVSFRRSGKNAGTAFLQQNRVNFHPVLLAANKAAFFSDVIPHEVSHLITWHTAGKRRRVKPHGPEWQAVMQHVYGVSPSTTHDFDLSVLGLTTFNYRCGCQTIELSVRRHNNVKKGMTYRCRRCGENLVFVEKSGVT